MAHRLSIHNTRLIQFFDRIDQSPRSSPRHSYCDATRLQSSLPRNCRARPRPIDWPRMFEARFQSFDDPQPAQTGPRVAALRAELARRGLSGFDPAARRPAPERIRAAVRGAAGLADRLHRLGRQRRRAGRQGRAVRRRPLHAAGARPGRRLGVHHRADRPRPRRSTGSSRICRPAPSSATTPGCTPSRAPSGSPRPAPTPAATLVPAEPNPVDAIWTDRPAPPLGAGGAARPAIRRRGDAATSSTASAPRSASCAPTRWWSPIRTRWPGPSTSAAPTWRTRRCRSPSRSCRRTAGPTLYVDSAKLSNAVRHKLEEIAEVREPDGFIARSHGARRRASAPCGSIRRPPPTRCRASSATPAAR